MREVKAVFQRVLDAPAPLMRDTSDFVAVARRSARRRSALTAAASTLVGTAAVVALAVVAGPAHAPSPPASPAASSMPGTAPFAPMPRLSSIDGHRVAAVLRDAVPAGLTPDETEMAPAWAIELHDGGYYTSTRVTMSTATGHGTLEVDFRFEPASAPTSDLCGTATAARVEAIASGADTDCRVVTVNGEQIRVVDSTAAGQVIAATRFFRGGFITVVSRQESLATPPLTPSEVVNVVVDLP